MDNFFMAEALKQAEKAFAIGEVPIGAVVVKDGVIIGRGYNTRESEKNPLKHAEITAIDEAAKNLDDWRLSGCTIYVTIEPCSMCSGAIINSRIARVVYGAKEEKTGCAGSVCNLFAMNFAHGVDITSGVMAEEALSLMERFFSELRR